MSALAAMDAITTARQPSQSGSILRHGSNSVVHDLRAKQLLLEHDLDHAPGAYSLKR
jgi:hypothetical protein